MTTRTVYKFGFFLGFAVLLVVLFLPMPGEPQMTWVEVETGRGDPDTLFAWLLALVPPLLPFVVVIEAGPLATGLFITLPIRRLGPGRFSESLAWLHLFLILD